MFIEYFYAAHSAFAYLGSRRFMAIAKAAGREIRHRPVDLDRVVENSGAGAFAGRSKAHAEYYFGREIIRWGEYREAPVMVGFPTHHFEDMTLPNCILIAAAEAGTNIDVLAHAFLEAHWRDDADLTDLDTLTSVAQDAAYDLAPLVEAAHNDAVKTIYEGNTVEAIERSIFGSPTYFVDGDMFYGQDRLELVERTLKQPFK
jgi:2-hydroxychromene-2-carboxylate isomerase